MLVDLRLELLILNRLKFGVYIIVNLAMRVHGFAEFRVVVDWRARSSMLFICRSLGRSKDTKHVYGARAIVGFTAYSVGYVEPFGFELGHLGHM